MDFIDWVFGPLGRGIGSGQEQNLLYIYHLSIIFCAFYFCMSVLLHIENVYDFFALDFWTCATIGKIRNVNSTMV